MNTQLQKSILQTLAFWDIFGQPLTKEELWQFLYSKDFGSKIEYTNFVEQINNLANVENKNGFYFLAGRADLVDLRQNKVKLLEEKMKLARTGIKKIIGVPFVRAIFLCNTVAMGIPEKNSDLDVLIVVKKGRIWLTRLLATLILSLWGKRRTKNKIANKICLSFYVSDDNLNLEKIVIKNDIYLVYWLSNLIPFYDPDNLHGSLIKANQWVNKYLVNNLAPFVVGPRFRLINSKFGLVFKKFWEKTWGGSYGNLLEAQAKGIQQTKMKMNLASVQNIQDTRVVINDSMLKFHEGDRREEYKNKWLERCENF